MSIIKTLTPVVHCAVKCLIEWRDCFSREKKNGEQDESTHAEAFNLKFRLCVQPRFKAFLISVYSSHPETQPKLRVRL